MPEFYIVIANTLVWIIILFFCIVSAILSSNFVIFPFFLAGLSKDEALALLQKVLAEVCCYASGQKFF